MNYRRQAGELAEAKTEHPWLGRDAGHCLQQTLMDLDKAYRAHGTFRVRWRPTHRHCPLSGFPEGDKMVVEQFNRQSQPIPMDRWTREHPPTSMLFGRTRVADVGVFDPEWDMNATGCQDAVLSLWSRREIAEDNNKNVHRS